MYNYKGVLVTPKLLFLQHLGSFYNCLLNTLCLIKPQVISVAAFLRNIKCNLPCLCDFPIQLVNIDMRLVHQESQDTGVQAVSDDYLTTSIHGHRAFKHVLVVKVPFIDYLGKEKKECFLKVKDNFDLLYF